MKLKKISITGFRSIKAPIELLLDDRVNILIGANDHGKTNILEAVRCLNDDRAIIEDDRNWDLSEQQSPRIQWHFSVTPEELSTFGQEATAALSIGETLGLNSDHEVVYVRDGVENPVKVFSVPMQIATSREMEVLALRPRIELFEAPKTNLVDRVNREELSTPSYEFMQGIFMLAGIWDHQATIFSQSDVNSKQIDEASGRLDKVLREDWNQGKELSWSLRHSGTNGDHIELRILDPSVANRYVRPSLRSSGFQTYFLISMITLARTQQNKQGSYIFLFDEPGTYLHPSAQLDLQRTFEKISDGAQIVYTTHSLFLVNKNHPSRNRVVSKTVQGTVIDQKPFQKNWKSVRTSLGILLSNNFLISEKSLLVEGPSDVIYILDAVRRLKSIQKVDIDLNDLSILDAGATDNFVAMAKVMLFEGRDVVALVDGDQSGTNIIKRLNKVCEAEINQGHLKIKTLPAHKSIEDVFADLSILQTAVKLTAETRVKSGARKLKDGLNLEAEIHKIKESESISLGKLMDDVTAGLFDDVEKLSKLSIALQYEDLMKDQNIQVKDIAEKLVKELKVELALKGERTVQEGVFEKVI